MAAHVHNNPEIQLSICSAMIAFRCQDLPQGQPPAAEQQLSEPAHHPSPCWFPRKFNISYVLNLNRVCDNNTIVDSYSHTHTHTQKTPPRAESGQTHLRARPSKQTSGHQDEGSVMVECAGIVRGESRSEELRNSVSLPF